MSFTSLVRYNLLIKKFVKVALDLDLETFVVYISAFIGKDLIHLFYIIKIATLLWDKAPIEVPTKYFNYVDVFSFDLVIELPKNTSINKVVMILVEEKQPPYGLIYTLSQIKLETLKM